MIEPFFPPPFLQALNPLERLRVYDSLMMNAQRWNTAHNYHRQRQNIFYQALNQPGIVYGLGIRKIPPPSEVSAAFKERPWLEIQPGIAIDWEGNPIIVPEEMTFPVTVPKETTQQTSTIYLVVSYRDPETLAYQNEEEMLRETFRLDQKTSPPTEGEVELCRFCWQPGISQLDIPPDVLRPQENQIDLRYRLQAQSRSLGIARLGTVTALSAEKEGSWRSLIKSLSVLYPSLQGSGHFEAMNLQSQEVTKRIKEYDLIYISGEDLQQLERQDIHPLAAYLKTGGVVLVESDFDDEDPDNLKKLVNEQIRFSGQVWERLSLTHLLRTEPFLFSALPTITGRTIELWHGGGIILIKGELSRAWGIDETLTFSRNEIRTAQEFGINLLYYAWRRHQLSQLLS